MRIHALVGGVAVAGMLGGCSLYFGDDATSGGHGEGQGDDVAMSRDAGTVFLDAGGSGPSVLAFDRPGIHEMQTDSAYLYWVNDGEYDHDAAIERMSLYGGSIETLYTDPARRRMSSLSFYGGTLFATVARTDNGDGQILQVPADGTGTGSASVLTPAQAPSLVRSGPAGIFFTEAAGSGYQIARFDGTGTHEVIAADVETPYDLQVAADGTVVYSEMDAGRIMRVTPGGDPVELAGGFAATGAIAIDGDSVYFVACASDCADARLERIALDADGSSPAETLYLGGPWSEERLAVWNSGLVNWGGRLIDTRGHSAPFVFSSGTTLAVAVSEYGAYAADYVTGAIYGYSVIPDL